VEGEITPTKGGEQMKKCKVKVFGKSLNPNEGRVTIALTFGLKENQSMCNMYLLSMPKKLVVAMAKEALKQCAGK
jgi:hypothetical protein